MTTTKRAEDIILLSQSSSGTTAKASSILQNNKKLYGPANALDYTNTLTSWNSEGNSNGKNKSFIVIDFSGGQKRTVNPVELVVQFQAGFAAEEITVYSRKITTTADKPQWLKVEEIEAEDYHEAQSFPLAMEEPTTALKIVFDETTDFYGRVIVYEIKIYGTEEGNNSIEEEQ
mmetsp:Transcript_58858/g.65841  ORF Transcript_58858/g.65841 Transcript_58858/m.65841 type:complete len:174 (+) Transcript_58858:72-593(+)